jgi:UDP-N-acetylmuramoyl-L-alanyl-D-glutamate--2,6-diaminopimelate ligase
VAARLGIDLPADASGALPVTGITHDSREVRPGDLYVALPGARVHGARFVTDAAAAGANAVLTDPDGASIAAADQPMIPVLVVDAPRDRLGALSAFVYGEPGAALTLVGITGTNGKTTTAYLLDAGFRAAGLRTGLIGTVETRIHDQVLSSAHTTPEAPDLQALLAVMRERGVAAVSMEVSSHALVLGRVDGTTYDVAIFTNLTEDHLDFHGDLDDYFAAKAMLFTPQRARLAVVNIDDPYGERLTSSADVPVITVSANGRPEAQWRVAGVEQQAVGSAFTVVAPGGERVAASVAIPGPFNVANALGAIVALVATGVPLATAVEGVAGSAGVPGRMEQVDAGQGFLAVVDYAHTPDAVERVLEALRPATRGRLVAVLGCGGDRDRAKRRPMGAAVARLADVAVLTSDNPRSEDPMTILAALEAGAASVDQKRRAEIVVEADRGAAIALAVSMARAGDTVAVLGKGHEQGQEAAGVLRPFDDRLELRRAIKGARA